MPATPPAIAEVRCLVIAGNDARRFAQAQFASDLSALQRGRWQWSAWLTPAGRVRALMQLFESADRRLVAVLRGGDAEAIRAGLAPYLLRAEATLTLDTRIARAGPAEPLATVRAQGEYTILGCGDRSLWLAAEPAEIDPAARAAWHLADIRAGWPSLPDGEPRQLGPALGLVRLGAIALDKGCYPGQEIIARLHHRGGQTRALHHIRGTPPPTPGEHATGSGARTLTVLDVESAGSAYEALVAAPQTATHTLDIDGVNYAILARFAS
ncbi:MAG TPA: folate-binding protein [Rhodanobacteraceae bacterium]|nr:folate-binding protein [Rhodanobacteraceae bacterium]